MVEDSTDKIDECRFELIGGSSSGSKVPAPIVGYKLLFNPFKGSDEFVKWGGDPRLKDAERKQKEEWEKQCYKSHILWEGYYDRQSRAESAVKKGKVKAGLIKVPQAYPGDRRSFDLVTTSDDHTYKGLYVAYIGSRSNLQSRPFWSRDLKEILKEKYSTIEDINTGEVFKVPSKDLELVGTTYIVNREEG